MTVPAASRNSLLLFLLCLFGLLYGPAEASGQYFRFGKNKVQYADLSWSYLQTQHFDVYYYEGGRDLAEFTARAAEDAYLQAERLFDHQLSHRVPILVYQSHNDFAVTNAIDLPDFSEGIAGVTEPFKNRIALPFVGDYRQYRQTLHHELIHAIVNDIYYGGPLQSIVQNNMRLQIPLWFNEGLAEYASEGWSSDADDWLRDAVVHDDVPDITLIGGFASYQAGQGVWDYIAEQYGREKISEILQRLRLTHSIDGSFRLATGLSLKELSDRWRKSLKQIYYPELAARESLTDFAKPIITEDNGGFYNTSPALSPLGDKLAFIATQNGLFDVFIADANEGVILKKLVEGQTSAEFESLRVLTPGLSWSPDGKSIALATKSGPSDAIAVIDVNLGKTVHYRMPDVDQIVSVAWSPEGRRIAFEASMDAQSDIYVLDLDTHETINYTSDVFSDHEPAWSPDGKTIVFHSDRGSYTALAVYTAEAFSIMDHDYGQYDIFSLSLDGGPAQRLTYNTVWDEQSAKFGSDPERLLFISDRNGIYNLYEKNLTTGSIRPLTNALSGITQVALSANGEKAALITLEEGRPLIYTMKSPFDRELDVDPLVPSVWAQRVMQETIDSAPAIALAPASMQRANPFLRDATDGIAYIRQPRPARTQMADQLMLLANSVPALLRTEALSSDESVRTSRYSWDSTRYGSVQVRFRDYTRERANSVPSDIESLIRPKEPENNIGEDGKYRPRQYKLHFSPDLVYGTAGYDALFGVQGIIQITFSDMLGNHRVFVASNLLIDLRNSDYMLSYSYLPKRVDYSGAVFHVSRLLRDNRLDTIYRYRQFGGRFSMSYPLDKFNRMDLDMSVVGVNQADIVEPNEPAISRLFLLPSITYTKDVTTPGRMYPRDGSRMSISLAGSPLGISKEKVSFLTLLGDARSYASLGRTSYTFALRFSAGTSLGPTQQLFYTAGVQNWINRRFDGENGFPIDDISDFVLATPILPMRGYHINARSGTNFGLVNAEFRFPLVSALVPGPLPIIPFYNMEGVVFTDIGALWGGRGLDNPFNVFRTNDAGKKEFDDVVMSTGFGVRTLLLGYPIRFDFAWPFDGQRFGKQRMYISIGFDF